MAKCPYDGLDCKKLTEGFEKWRRAVEAMSANQTKLVFVTTIKNFILIPIVFYNSR